MRKRALYDRRRLIKILLFRFDDTYLVKTRKLKGISYDISVKNF